MNTTVCYAPSDTATTDLSVSGTSDNDENKDKEENNQDGNFDFNKSLWQDDPEKTDDDPNKQEPTFDPDKKKKASEFVNEHIKSLGLLKDIDFTSMSDGNGFNVENVQKGFDKLAENLYLSVMRDSNKVATNKINAAVKEAVAKSTSEVDITNAFSRMEARLPATKNPNIAPIAQQALNKFRNKGQSVEEAINNVDKFLKATAAEVTNNRADDPPPRRPGSGSFGVNQSDSPPPVEDWEAYLKE